MKIINKIATLLIIALLPVSFIGCSDDKKPDPVSEETPDFVLEQESIRVKIGAENKTTLDIKQGGGEYNAFTLDDQIATVEIANGAIMIEGFANGQTSLIISDKYNRYRRLPVAVYTTDVIELSHKTINLKTKLGTSGAIIANVVLGNGGYTVSSDHPGVSVFVSEEGEISIAAVSKKQDYTATVTVTDITGLSESITISVIADLEPYTDEELETIMENNTTCYFYDGFNMYSPYYRLLNETLTNGKQRYGWDYYTYYWYYIDFEGDKSVGVKKDAVFSYYEWGGKEITPSVTLKIIKNDGTNIWGIFSYINDDEEKLYTGYFCNKV